VNAALASYPELTEDGQAPELYTGIEVGFSTLSVHREVTYRFLDEVLAELAELTPGPYLHIGGDEAQSTTETDYQTFADRAVPLVGKHGKTAITWHELARTNPLADTILQFWGTSGDAPETIAAVKRGNKLIMSPANRAYLDQKYTEDTELGLKWAAYIEVADAYDWDPATYLADVDDSAILGVEAPLWSETITNTDAMDFLAYPRLPAIAEIAWSPKETHDWADFRARLATHGPRWERQGIAFHRSPDVPWAD
jgi:hexosaminidase